MLITATTPTPAVQATAPRAVERTEKTAPESKREATPQERAKSAPTPNRPSQYRIAYDEERSRVFIQVIDPESGEEILRFPPEELVRFIDKSIGTGAAGNVSGLLVDRSA